jgi:hypothetical protein
VVQGEATARTFTLQQRSSPAHPHFCHYSNASNQPKRDLFEGGGEPKAELELFDVCARCARVSVVTFPFCNFAGF